MFACLFVCLFVCVTPGAIPYLSRTVSHSWPFAGSSICPVPYRTIKHSWLQTAGHNIMYMYTTPCVLHMCLKGTVALFVAPFYLSFQSFLLLVLPRGWLWVHQSYPWSISEFAGARVPRRGRQGSVFSVTTVVVLVSPFAVV